MHLTNLAPTQHVRCVPRRKTWFQFLLDSFNPSPPVFTIELSRFVKGRLQIHSRCRRKSKSIKDSVVPQNFPSSNCSRGDKYGCWKPVFLQNRESKLIVVAVPVIKGNGDGPVRDISPFGAFNQFGKRNYLIALL